MAQKTTTATAVEEKKKEGFWSTKITGVSLPLYLIMVLVLIIEITDEYDWTNRSFGYFR